MPRHLPLTAFVLCVLLVPTSATAVVRAAMQLDRGAVATGKAGYRVQLRGRCAVPPVVAPTSIKLHVGHDELGGTLSTLGSAGHGTVRLQSETGAHGRLMLRPGSNGDSLLHFRINVSLPEAIGAAVPIELRIGDAVCARPFVFQRRPSTRGSAYRFPWAGRINADGDVGGGGDCAPGDPGVHPGAVDVCENGVDEDCDGRDAACDPPRFPGLVVSPDDQPIAGDLNLDGTSDLVSMFYDEIIVQYGRGDGTFMPGPTIRRDLPNVRAIADVDRDGWPDLVATHPDGAALSVLYGTASGGFGDDSRIPIGPSPFEVIPVDLDHDGFVDLVSSHGDPTGDVVIVARGLGGRTFAPPVAVPTVGYVVNMVAGDVNNDGALDVAVVTSAAAIQIFLGNGRGQLVPSWARMTPSGNSGMHGIVLGRFDAGATLDLAVSGFDAVATLFGNGDGTFTEGPRYAAGGFSAALATADLDGNETRDLAVGGAGILRGDGAGVFTVDPSVGPAHVGAQVGAFGKSGATDLVLGGSLFPARNLPSKAIPLDQFVRMLAVADLNADGDPDYVLAGGSEENEDGSDNAKLTVVFGTPDGEPIESTTVVIPAQRRFDVGFQALALGDVDGDGQPDALVSRWSEGAVRLFRGVPGGTFMPAGTLAIGSADALAAADLDGDGALDIVASNAGAYRVTVARGDGTGGFAAAERWPACRDVVPASPSHGDVEVADVDGDAIPDLIVGCAESAEVAVLHGLGGGAFAPQALYETGGESYGVTAADFDGDGHADLAVALFDGGGVATLRNLGDGRFADWRWVGMGPSMYRIATPDVDGDGRVDLVGSSLLEDRVWLARGDGNGGFAAAQGFIAETFGGLAVVDANRDGALDLVTTGGSELRVLLQTPP